MGAALGWAVASVLFSRVRMSAESMALIKNTLASGMMLAVLVIASFRAGRPLVEATAEAFGLLAASAVIGLVAGDIAYFRSLQLLGARRGLAMTLLTPPTAALLGRWLLTEALTWQMRLSMILTLGGLGIVMWERTPPSDEQESELPAGKAWGVFFGLLAVACQAGGAILMKQGTGQLRTVEVTFLRLIAAALVGWLLAGVLRRVRTTTDAAARPGNLRRVALASFFGTFLGVWMYVTAFKYTPAGVAATVTSLAPIFVIPIAVYGLRQRVSALAVAGSLAAFAGVGMLFL